MTDAQLLVVDLFPSLMQPEGDHGNGLSLVHRARSYNLPARLVTVHPGSQIPAADIYLLGGSEDLDLAACAAALSGSDVLARAVDSGAAVLGVGAGFTVLCADFEDSRGAGHRGVGLLDATMRWSHLADSPVVSSPNRALRLPALSGYEFHHGRVERGPGVAPFVALEVGVGDGSTPPTDGAVSGQVIGTWLHGPLLPRNPAVADLLLGWVRPQLFTAPAGRAGLDDRLADEVRAQRISQARPNQ